MATLRVEYEIAGCQSRIDGEFTGNNAQVRAESAAAWCGQYADTVWIKDENGRLIACLFAND